MEIHLVCQHKEDAKLLQDGNLRDALDVKNLSERGWVVLHSNPHALLASNGHEVATVHSDKRHRARHAASVLLVGVRVGAVAGGHVERFQAQWSKLEHLASLVDLGTQDLGVLELLVPLATSRLRVRPQGVLTTAQAGTNDGKCEWVDRPRVGALSLFLPFIVCLVSADLVEHADGACLSRLEEVAQREQLQWNRTTVYAVT